MAAEEKNTESNAAATTVSSGAVTEPNAVADGGDDTVSNKNAEVDATELERADREEFEAFVTELQAKINARSQLRAENLNCERPGESYFTKLDSNLKRNTAFVKKLKQFTASQLELLIKDMNSLNLSKYISEICAALSEAKLKMTDVPMVISLCSQLHRTYADFADCFLEAWQKALACKAGEKIANASKLRVDLRLFAELISSGVISGKQGLSLLGGVLMNVISQDKEDHSNFPIILSFCRHCGEEYAGLVPRKMQLLAEKYGDSVAVIPKSNFLPPEKQQNLRTLLKDYFRNLSQHVVNEHENLLRLTKSIKHNMVFKGKVSNSRKEKCDLMQASFDKLLSSALTLADLLDEPLPDLPKDTESTSDGNNIDNMLEDIVAGELDPWGDEETRCFYTDLPDLRQFLPNFSAPKIHPDQVEETAEMTEEALDADIDADIELDDPPSNASDPPNDRDAPDGVGGAGDAAADDVPPPAGVALPDKIAVALMEAGRSGTSAPATGMGPTGAQSKQNFDNFLANLNNCVNKELIDSAAIEFLLTYNTKNNRKRLTKSIFAVHRTRLDLLPFLSRFVAIVNLCNTDVAVDLSERLRQEFKWHIRRKNQLNIESKIKIARFIGEMVKFGLCKKFDALGCLKMLLRDFQHHQIEMACALTEVAGVYLYNCRESRLLTNIFLDQMMRLKTATALDSRHAAQVENVFYLVKPPESVKADVVLRSPMQEYIRHLIFEELCKQNVDRCIKMLRRINWTDAAISNYAIKCLSKAYLLRFPLIRCLADLVSGLSSYQERAVTMVVDNVFEDIRAGLEIHSPKLAQRRIAMAKYLGELYNYKLVQSINILNTLYSIISLGVATEEGAVSELDPPDSLFRLKLACVLLDTCGQYFTSSASREKLDYFLMFFQQYYWIKKSHPIFSHVENSSDLFPILVDHMYRDCLANVRPKLKLYKSLEQARQAIEDLRAKFYPQLKEGGVAQDADNTAAEPDHGLKSIREDSEALSDDSSSEIDGRARGADDGEEAYANADDAANANELANTTDWTENEMTLEDGDVLPAPREPEKSKEDMEFEQLFERMSADSYQERLKETVKPNTKDIPVPMMARTGKKTYEQISSSSTTNVGGNNQSAATTSAAATAQAGGGGTPSAGKDATPTANNNGAAGAPTSAATAVPFVLMVRGGKGGKQQFRQFIAPPDSHLAINLRLQEEKTREEKERVKQLTLNITERFEEEDYQESLLPSQRNNSSNHYYQRPSKPKFKHQKGAPDADLIFN